MTTAADVVRMMSTQAGDRYVFGAEASRSDTDPDAFDCSELIEWACGRLDVSPRMPDGSWIQARHVRQHGTELDVRRAIWTPGALLFRFSGDPYSGGRPRSSHVAVALGDGRTIEARGRRYGVGHFTAAQHERGWTHAGRIPGVTYPRADRMPWDELAALVKSAGLSGDAAVTAVAIAAAESGRFPDAVGDVTLTTPTWGASIGLWQIRSDWSHSGKGWDRDPTRLREPAFNAWAMTVISLRGSRWSPWSVFNSGRHLRFMDTARRAVIGAEDRELRPELASWARESWAKAETAGMWSESSRPGRAVTDQRLAVFLDRLGLFD